MMLERNPRRTPPTKVLPYLALLIAMSSCSVTPKATSLPATAAASTRPVAAGAQDPAASLPVQPLDLDDVKGGRIVYTLPLPPEEALAMLLDFEHAAGHRSWAATFDILSVDGDTMVVRWHFRGRMGVTPSPEITFRTIREADGPITVRFEHTKAALGIAAFFGEHQIWAAKDTPESSLIATRTFIDSGIPFVNASRKDIASGLRKDVEMIRIWARERAR